MTDLDTVVCRLRMTADWAYNDAVCIKRLIAVLIRTNSLLEIYERQQ